MKVGCWLAISNAYLTSIPNLFAPGSGLTSSLSLVVTVF